MGVRFALYTLVALGIGLYLRETAKAWMIVRQGDLYPRLHGRLPIRLKEAVDPLGTVIVPALIAILIASGLPLPPFAYAKPMPQDSGRIRNTKQVVLAGFAGSVANALVAAGAGLVLRLGIGGEAAIVALAILQTGMFLAVFHLMPIPGLDGAAILARFLPPRPREVFTSLDPYQPLFVLVIFFILGTLLLPIVVALTDSLCRAVAGIPCSL